MKSTTLHISSSGPSGGIRDGLAASSESHFGGWRDIVNKISTYLPTSTTKAPSAPDALRHLTGLLQMQMDITRYQLRVEVVSKIAESGVASLRKLQQSQ